MLFFSHSTKDKPAALDIQQRLLSRGYDTAQLFLNSDKQSGIEAGTKWRKVLYERLKDCRALVVLHTPNWKASQWCFAELVYAKMSGKEIFPVVLADGDLGGLASEHQAVFVTKDGDQAYERLFAALEARHLGPRDQPIPTKPRSYTPIELPTSTPAVPSTAWNPSAQTEPRMRSGSSPNANSMCSLCGLHRCTTANTAESSRNHRVNSTVMLCWPTMNLSQTAECLETLPISSYSSLANPQKVDERWQQKRGSIN